MRSIPADLAQALEEWHVTYRRLAARPGTPLRRKLIRLSARVVFHPHWEHGRRTAARSALHTTERRGRS